MSAILNPLYPLEMGANTQSGSMCFCFCLFSFLTTGHYCSESTISFHSVYVRVAQTFVKYLSLNLGGLEPEVVVIR